MTLIYVYLSALTHPSGIGSKRGTFSTSHNTAGAALAPPAPSVAHNFDVATDDLIPNAFVENICKQHKIMVDAIQNVYPNVHGFIVCYFVVELIAVERALPSRQLSPGQLSRLCCRWLHFLYHEFFLLLM